MRDAKLKPVIRANMEMIDNENVSHLEEKIIQQPHLEGSPIYTYSDGTGKEVEHVDGMCLQETPPCKIGTVRKMQRKSKEVTYLNSMDSAVKLSQINHLQIFTSKITLKHTEMKIGCKISFSTFEFCFQTFHFRSPLINS